MRLYDVTSGYSGQATICDFLLYSYPNLFYLELKAEKTANLPFSNITRHQYEGLLEKADYEGAIPGIIVTFNKIEDAQAVIDNPNFREILDTIYK